MFPHIATESDRVPRVGTCSRGLEEPWVVVFISLTRIGRLRRRLSGPPQLIVGWTD